MLDELDSLTGWTKWDWNPYGGDFTFGVSSNRHSGSGSLFTQQYGGAGWGYLYKTFNFGSGSWAARVWHYSYVLSGEPNHYVQAWNYCGSTPEEHAGSGHQYWQMEKFSGSGGPCTARLGTALVYDPDVLVQSYVDKLVVTDNENLRVASLVAGQVVKLYRAVGDVLVDTKTVGGGGTYVDLDYSAEDYPESCYLKIYGTDGITLLETTASYEMCGGDIWEWFPASGTLSLASDAKIIYIATASATPKTANITATLLDSESVPYPGATVYFETTLGTITPASDVTDGDGEAHAALTATVQGVAIVTAKFLGDATVLACSATYLIYVFYEAESGDPDRAFQVFIHGHEIVFVGGRYGLNEEGVRESFEVELPEWDSAIVYHGLVSIYRKGVLEFSGVLMARDRTLSDCPRVIIRGPDLSQLLFDRVVTTETYSLTPQAIIADLLTKYPTGIIAGVLDTYPSTISVPLETEYMYDAIKRVADQVGWKFRLNADRTLDFAASFSGGIVDAPFTEGQNILSVDHDVDYTNLANHVRLKGDGITSTKEDLTSIQAYGLRELPAFEPSISVQATLDIACQALLSRCEIMDETVILEGVDSYALGTFGPEDQIAITVPSLAISGNYMIKRIERDLTDADYVRFELTSRAKQFWDLDAAYRRMTQDLGR